MKINQLRPMKTLGLASALVAVLASQAHSQNLDYGESDAYGLQVGVTALNVLGVSVGPLPEVQISTPDTGTNQDTLLTISESLLLADIVAENGSDDAILVSAASDVTGFNPTGFATGSSTVNGLEISIIPGVLIFDDLITISATTIGSTSSSSGSYGSLSSTGTSNLQDLQIWIGGNAITLDVNAAPNTILDVSAGGIAGIQIVLNEQIATGDGISSAGMTTNALRVSLDAVSFGGFDGVSGDVVVGHSYAGVSAVPEPGVPVMLGFAFGLWSFRRSRRMGDGDSGGEMPAGTHVDPGVPGSV